MAYTPTNWQNGDVITAEKLNNIENGVASAVGAPSYDLVLAYADTDSDPVLTGHGLSFDEIVQKIKNHESIAMMASVDQEIYGNWYVGIYKEGKIRSNGDDYQVVFGENYSYRLDYTYTEGYYSGVCINGANFTFVYDSTSKEYTFTFTGWVD